MIKFTGTRTEFGQFYGERLRKFHHDFYRTVNEDTLRRQQRIYERFYPELVTERLAAAEVLGLPAEFLLYEDLASFVDAGRKRLHNAKPTEGCTIFALNDNGHCFVGRNYDWNPQARDFFEQYDLDLKGAYRYFTFSDESVWGRHTGKKTRKIYAEDALNEYGLYIGLTYAHLGAIGYGLSPSHLIRYIAEHCRTTRQALNAFAKIPCAVPKNFVIADAKGDIAAVEHAAKSYEVVRPGMAGTREIWLGKTAEQRARQRTKGKTASELANHQMLADCRLMVHTNHYLSPRLRAQDLICAHNPTANSFLRYEETKHLVEMQLPGFQFTDIWRIMRESHYVYSDETIWSLALDLTDGRYNVYYDTAQGQQHDKFSF